MKYLFLVYFDEQASANWPPEQRASYQAACCWCLTSMAEEGHLLVAQGLDSAARLFSSGVGLAAEPDKSKAACQPTAYYLVEARDLNQAIQLAIRIPAVRYGGVEIRAVLQNPIFLE